MSQAPPARNWFPALCTWPRLAVMLGLAELVVVLLALAPDGAPRWDLGHFVSSSAFAMWQAISVTALLCVMRPFATRLGGRVGTLCALGK